MHANKVSVPQLAVPARETRFLTVKMVMPAEGDAAGESASLPRMLVALSALAFERFGGDRENHCPDALRDLVSSCLAGASVDPFDGQLLRLRKADRGCQLQTVGPDRTDTPVGKGDLAFAVENPLQGLPAEEAESQATSNA